MIDVARIRAIVRDHGGALLVDVGVNFGLPYLIYSTAEPHVGEVRALLASSLPPLAWSIVEFVRRRRLDAVSALALAGILLSLLACFGGGGARMLQLREKLVTGVIGLVFLGSAAIGRPLILALVKAGMARAPAAPEDEPAILADDARLRRSMTIMTLVWGVVLLLDVAVASVLVFALPVATYMIVGGIESYAVLGALCLWTWWYARRVADDGDSPAAD